MEEQKKEKPVLKKVEGEQQPLPSIEEQLLGGNELMMKFIKEHGATSSVIMIGSKIKSLVNFSGTAENIIRNIKNAFENNTSVFAMIKQAVMEHQLYMETLTLKAQIESDKSSPDELEEKIKKVEEKLEDISSKSEPEKEG